MKITIDIPEYHPEQGIQCHWEDGFEINVAKIDDQIRIKANKAGLKSLANHFLNLSQESIPSGKHIHLDEFNSLEVGSLQLVIEKSQR